MADTGAVQATNPPKVLIVTGPTGVGKTDLSLTLAEQLNGEIISADSVQVYRGLDVGSDKIPVEQRRGIVHHMIDVLDRHEEFSAGLFYDKARQLTEEILERGHTPIVVGGTGFYLKWFTYGKPATKDGSVELKAMLENRLQEAWASAELVKGSELSEEEKWTEGILLLEQAGDPEAAKRIGAETNNYYRLMRALEVVVGTGKVMSELDINFESSLDYDFRCFFLSRPRLELFDRIGRRCEQMVRNGILEEAAMMLDEGLEPSQNCATRAIGYRQAMEYLQPLFRGESEVTEEGLERLILDIQSATRQLVKQQTTWFKKDGLYQLVDISNEAFNVAEHIIQEYNKPKHDGGFGDHCLTKDELKAIKCFVAKLHDDPSSRAPVLDWVKKAVEERLGSSTS
ncbi:hypothetical protein BSKO_01711 [Bryopsis sp. KO-2023]|nr:hypothetical protein BSKO_01711 [Bryopsis sp. KO-2023]